MHFAKEPAEPEKLHVPKKTTVGKREKEMAEAIVKSMSAKWDPEKHKDDYREALMEVIEEKVESGGEEIEEKPKEKKTPTKVIDLVEVLQQSLKAQSGGRRSTRRRRRSSTRKRRELAPAGFQSASSRGWRSAPR